MILAANIAPMDVISHIPLLCEEKGIPYIFVSSKVHSSLGMLTCRKHWEMLQPRSDLPAVSM